MDYRPRQTRVRKLLAERRLDALLVTHLPNVRYLTGFTGSSAQLLVPAARSALFTDGRYTQQAREEVQGAQVVIAKGPLLKAVATRIGERGLKAIGFESEHMSVADRQRLARALPARAHPCATSGTVEALRMVKEEEELEQIQAAVVLASSLFDGVVRRIEPGALESEIAGELEHAARRAGAEGMSFETIVAAGPRSALPHGRASSQPVPNRGFVILDFGVILAGYCSDMTRTVHVGRPPARARAMYQAVREAQQAGIAAVRPGTTAGEVDAAARQVLQRAGWGRFFTHSTGHGVGLEIHEPPRLGKGEKTVLRPGMVVTIEPGIYVPGEGGVRIEDMVVVTENGCDLLTPTSKELLIL